MTYDCRSVLKLVLTCYDIVSHVVGLSYVVSLSYETKIVPCKSALRNWAQTTSLVNGGDGEPLQDERVK